jgi:hypothetical protein
MRIEPVDPDLIPADDDRWEPVRPSPWPAMAYLLLLLVLVFAAGWWWAEIR